MRAAVAALEKERGPASGGERAEIRSVFEDALDLMHGALDNRALDEKAASLEAFEIAQWVDQSAAATALNQLSARFSSGSSELAKLVRQEQDLLGQAKAIDESLTEEVSKDDNIRIPGQEDRLRRAQTEITKTLQELRTQLADKFPTYAALANPKPAAAADATGALGQSEAMLFLVATQSQTHLFVVTPAGIAWRTAAIPERALLGRISSFRRGLTFDEYQQGRVGDLFDLSIAYGLYHSLLGPVDDLIKDKPQLLIVPTGAFTSLPFDVLLTQEPPSALPKSMADLSIYREVAWLFKRQAITVLPSVAGLSQLRGTLRKSGAARPMVGFGDPVFNLKRETERVQTKGGTLTVMNAGTYFWQGHRIDPKDIHDVLPRLEETADHLRLVAKSVGAPESDIHLGSDASETTVKHLPLDQYRIVYFATHGLVADDLLGVNESALALTIPDHPSAEDDGLLTASEIARLKLNADWVVHEACNTIAGDKPGAEALSGLARAFFYAGARALLVSHWSVEVNAAGVLIEGTFGQLQQDRSIGRAQALRLSMLNYLEHGPPYPAFWAPFELVGDGGPSTAPAAGAPATTR